MSSQLPDYADTLHRARSLTNEAYTSVIDGDPEKAIDQIERARSCLFAAALSIIGEQPDDALKSKLMERLLNLPRG